MGYRHCGATTVVATLGIWALRLSGAAAKVCVPCPPASVVFPKPDELMLLVVCSDAGSAMLPLSRMVNDRVPSGGCCYGTITVSHARGHEEDLDIRGSALQHVDSRAVTRHDHTMLLPQILLLNFLTLIICPVFDVTSIILILFFVALDYLS